MLNWIWAAFFLVAFVAAVVQATAGGNPDVLRAVVASLFDSSKTGFEIAIGLTGVMSLWLGLMKIGEKGGVLQGVARLVGRTHWRLVGAFEGDALVACAALYLAGEAAWLGLAATRPTHRRRGAQTALIARRIAIAHAAGVRTLAAETTEDTREKLNPSTHNLRRLGFRDHYLRPNWVKVLREG